MSKELLIVVDYQKDFVDGSLGFEQAVTLEQPIYDKILAYKERGQDVIFTLDTHGQNYLDTREGEGLPFMHCLRESDGWQLYGKVAALCDASTRCFEKSTFGSLELAQYLREEGYERIELVGVVTNICVISNAILAQAALPQAYIFVDASCCASNDPAMHDKALDVMVGLQMQITHR